MERCVGVVPRSLVCREYLQTAVDLLDKSERSIELVSYAVSPVIGKKRGAAWSVVDALCRAAGRGVVVRVIFERSPREKSGARAARLACRFLESGGVRARLGPRGLTVHSKFVLLDGVYSVVGSHNLTNRALTRNHEVSVLNGDALIARGLMAGFERLWQRAGVDGNAERREMVHRRSRGEGGESGGK